MYVSLRYSCILNFYSWLGCRLSRFRRLHVYWREYHGVPTDRSHATGSYGGRSWLEIPEKNIAEPTVTDRVEHGIWIQGECDIKLYETLDTRSWLEVWRDTPVRRNAKHIVVSLDMKVFVKCHRSLSKDHILYIWLTVLNNTDCKIFIFVVFLWTYYLRISLLKLCEICHDIIFPILPCTYKWKRT